jgi:hypothetical protein
VVPKIGICMPVAMYAKLRRRLSVSELAQRAFAVAPAVDANREWIARARRRPVQTSMLTTEELMAAVDEDVGL